MRVMALDISKGKSYVVVYKEEKCTDEFEVLHNQNGFNQLRTILKEAKTEVVFEATGAYSSSVESFLNTEGIPYCKLNPLLAKMQTQTLRSNKTDRVDAHKLAQSHYIFNREISTAQNAVYLELKEVASFYDEIKRTLIKERNQLHGALQKTFPEIEGLYSNNLSNYVLKIIKKYPHPDIVLEHSRTKIKNQILLFTKKRLSQEQGKKKAEELIEMAKQSYPSVDKNHFLVTEIKIRVGRMKDLLDTKKMLSQTIINLTRNLPEFKVLISIPGIGDLSAALIIAEVGDIRRFQTSNKMNAYIGIDIRTYQSGTLQKKDRINKRGNANARMIFYFVVRNMLKVQRTSPNHIVDYYYKMKKQPFNKHDKVAMVACMNKLVKVIHFLVNTENLYDYTKSPQS